jgi:hypothetical protein
VLNLWSRLFPRKPELGGAPRVGRQKTYSAESGYVYQYVLSTFRQHRRRGEQVHDYTFEVTTGHEAPARVSVILRSSVLEEWVNQHGRELTASERYAIAKISLKRQLDDSETPESVPADVEPRVADVDSIASFLGF